MKTIKKGWWCPLVDQFVSIGASVHCRKSHKAFYAKLVRAERKARKP